MLVEYSEAESSILGAVFLRPEALDDVDLLPEEFYDRKNRDVFSAMKFLRDGNGKVDPVTVADELKRTGKLEAIGGFSFLSSLLSIVPSADNVSHYAADVRKAAQTRGVIDALSKASAGLKAGLEGEELLGHCVACLSAVETRMGESSQLMTDVIGRTFGVLSRAAEGAQPDDRVATGYEALDRLIGGLPLGIVTILGGRPAMGKSALARGIADNVAAAGGGVHYFSLEDTWETLGKRTLADHSRVSLEKFVTLDMKEGDKAPISMAAHRIREYGQLWRVDDEAGLSSAQIVSRVRRHRKALGTKVVVVDYLQHVHEPDAKGDKVEFHRANAVMRAMVNLARSEGVAVLLVAQLNRDLEKRTEDRRPRMSDLRDSGTLEQDAKVILLVYRDEFYTKDKCQNPGTGEVIVAKNSNGRTGAIEMQWDAPAASYRTLSRRG